jgi:hypothetical protein
VAASAPYSRSWVHRLHIADCELLSYKAELTCSNIHLFGDNVTNKTFRPWSYPYQILDVTYELSCFPTSPSICSLFLISWPVYSKHVKHLNSWLLVACSISLRVFKLFSFYYLDSSLASCLHRQFSTDYLILLWTLPWPADFVRKTSEFASNLCCIL